MRKDIIQSKTEPNKSDIWLSEEGLKKYGKDGWELLGGGVSPNTPTANDITGEELIPINQNGENKAITIEQIKNEVLELPSKYEFVDLGLPSGLKWATTNVGAEKPEDFGLYFQWGETEGYTADDVTNGVKQFNWSDYKFTTDGGSTFTKYNETDGKIILDLEDNAAYQSDNTCRIPTKSEIQEFIDNTTPTWETLNGVKGKRFTSNINGNSIFVPAAGYCAYGSVDSVGFNGGFWSSSLNESDSMCCWSLYFDYSDGGISNDYRLYGSSIRPVQPADIPTTINLKDLKDKVDLIETDGDGTKFLSDDGEYKEINIEQIKKEVINNGIIEFPSKYEFVDLGLPSGTMWATCNIGANSPEESGLYFAWGETEGYTAEDVAAGKKAFTWDDYKFGNSDALTKYNSTDGLIQLELIDDAAYQMDSTFRVPNYAELAELNNCTTSTWETLNGVNGRRYVSNINGNSIFIPAAGYYNSGSLEYGNSQGYYWGNGIVSYSTDYGDYFGFNEEYAYPYSTSRNYGFPIRPVKPSKFAPIDLKNLSKTPYVWDGTTISETIFMELLAAIRSNREIIVSAEGQSILNYRLIGSTYIAGTIALTFCNTLNAPNFLFTDYYITPNSVEYKTTSFYNKRDSDNTRLNTAFYTNIGLITKDTTFTNKGTLSSLEYDGQFNFGDTIYNITFPSGVKWSTDSVLDYKSNHTYQFKIVRGFGVMKEFANA